MIEAEIPTIQVETKAERGVWILSFECPVCSRGRRKVYHSHGGGPTHKPPDYGHRVTHCPDLAPDGYFLQPKPGGAPQPQPQP